MSKRGALLEAFQDTGGHWRWHLIAQNGRLVATSGESFDSQHNAVRAAANVRRLMGLVQRVSVQMPVNGVEIGGDASTSL